mmetsp:Transcript_83655/g.174978  ORF Transcript_83655/g.174978 Transcript_83655/m.174978 type:complete len:414 (-) Transcript_83655:322-1563(-)
MVSEGSKTAFLIVAMLVLGSWNTLNTKFQFQTCVPIAVQYQDIEKCPGGGAKKFDKPWLDNMFMFIGEASLIIVYGLSRRRNRRAEARTLQVDPAQVEQGLLPADQGRKLPLYIFGIPAFCDVFGTGLATVGMQYMDSAIWQMLRSAIIIFSALLSVTFLGKRLPPYKWVAVAIVFVGLVLVGYASMMDPDSPAGTTPESGGSEKAFGIALVVGAQLVSAFQMVFEEKLLTGSVKCSAKKVVGMEGLWGGFFMIIILILMSTLPGKDAGHFEYTPQGLEMLAASPTLLVLIPTYMISIAFYNLVGITVGKRMSAVVRCLVDSCRTVVVWAVNLIIFYGFSETYGSPWKPHSWLTAVGFLVLIFGTLMYNEVLPMPKCLQLPEEVAPGDTDSVLERVTSDLVVLKADIAAESDD